MQVPSPLSRTASATSIESSFDENSVPDQASGLARRTRKRFTSAQLAMLEELFHEDSHPSRGQREAVAERGGMEVKSVTIWFQNKRQTERRVALHNATNLTTGRRHVSLSPKGASFSFPSTSRSMSARPSLDRVASLTELRMPAPPPPRTPTRRLERSENIWENMPSSPIAPPFSPPPPREYLEYARTKRTLEWACAAARLASKTGAVAENESLLVEERRREMRSLSGRRQQPRRVHRNTHHRPSKLHKRKQPQAPRNQPLMRVVPSSAPNHALFTTVPPKLPYQHYPVQLHVQPPKQVVLPQVVRPHREPTLDSTDDEVDEAVTPPGTLRRADFVWASAPTLEPANVASFREIDAAIQHTYKTQDDDDVMKAALALCGLGRR